MAHYKHLIRYLSYFFGLFLFSTTLLQAQISVIASENFYADIAKTIGKKEVNASSILSNPNSDPHLFSVSPQTMIQLNNAQVIIYNGHDYDPWMTQILNSQNNNKKSIINVSHLMHLNANPNPHIWYDPNTFPTLAKKLADTFSEIEPQNKAYFQQNLTDFLTKYQIIFNTIQTLKSKTNQLPVTATEPLFGYMAKALGMKMKGLDLQWRIMNGTEASPKMMANYLDLFKQKKVKILFYNLQVKSPLTDAIKQLAEKNQIAIIGISETMPEGDHVTNWLLSTLEQINTLVKNETNHN